jgi:hypothetical protein
VGGPVLVALAVYGAVRLLRQGGGPAAWAVACWAAVVPIAYTFFYGAFGMSHGWDGVQMMGPYYHLPMIVPLVVFAARGLCDLAATRRQVAASAVLAMTVFTVWSIPDKVAINRLSTDGYSDVRDAIDAADLHDAVLFLPLRTEGGYSSITPFLEYDPDMDADVLYAQDCGTAMNRSLLESYPERAGYRLVVIDSEWPRTAESYAVFPIEHDAAGRYVECTR